MGERYNRDTNLNTFDVDEFDRWSETSCNLTLYYEQSDNVSYVE